MFKRLSEYDKTITKILNGKYILSNDQIFFKGTDYFNNLTMSLILHIQVNIINEDKIVNALEFLRRIICSPSFRKYHNRYQDALLDYCKQHFDYNNQYKLNQAIVDMVYTIVNVNSDTDFYPLNKDILVSLERMIRALTEEDKLTISINKTVKKLNDCIGSFPVKEQSKMVYDNGVIETIIELSPEQIEGLTIKGPIPSYSK